MDITKKDNIEKIAKIIHPNYGLPHQVQYDCCFNAKKNANTILALIMNEIKNMTTELTDDDGTVWTVLDMERFNSLKS
jgi:hypothetical protein